MLVQLEPFKNKDEFEFFHLRKDLESVLHGTDKVRKSLFAKHNELKKENEELKKRIEILERFICRGVIWKVYHGEIIAVIIL